MGLARSQPGVRRISQNIPYRIAKPPAPPWLSPPPPATLTPARVRPLAGDRCPGTAPSCLHAPLWGGGCTFPRTPHAPAPWGRMGHSPYTHGTQFGDWICIVQTSFQQDQYLQPLSWAPPGSGRAGGLVWSPPRCWGRQKSQGRRKRSSFFACTSGRGSCCASPAASL